MAVNSAIAFALLVVFPRSPLAAPTDHRWTLGLGGAGAFPYTYHQDPPGHDVAGSEDKFGRGFVGSSRLGRRVGEKVSIQTALDYYRRQDDENGMSVRIVSVSSGIRHAIGRDQYVEFLPSLHAGRWTDTAYGSSITRLRPGFQVGVGVQGPIAGPFRLDLGLKFRYSTGWPNARWRAYDSEDFRGLRQVVLGGTVLFGL